MEEEIFRKYVLNERKLQNYGFVKNEDYFYKLCNLDDEFLIIISIKNNIVKAKVLDKETKEEYTNYRLKTPGEYAGKIKEKVIDLLNDIKDKCYIEMPFCYPQSNRITSFIKEKYEDHPEFLWDDGVNGVFRKHKNKKWYGIIMYIPKKKLDFGEEYVEVMNVKLPPEKINQLVEKNGYYRAYHMNKKYWISIILNDTLKDKEIIKLIDESYTLTSNKEDK